MTVTLSEINKKTKLVLGAIILTTIIVLGGLIYACFNTNNIRTKFIKQIEDGLNNYPHVMFDYKSSNMLLYRDIKKLTFR